MALDEWLSKGGFHPDAWAHGPVDTDYLVEVYDKAEDEDPTIRCRNCGLPLHQRPEKALSGEVQMVWADSTDAWVCSFTGDEHRAGVRA
jgi:uncharacterized Zn finger protein